LRDFIDQLGNHLFLPRGNGLVGADRRFDGEEETRFLVEIHEHGPRCAKKGSNGRLRLEPPPRFLPDDHHAVLHPADDDVFLVGK